jgi:hypothetical protein
LGYLQHIVAVTAPLDRRLQSGGPHRDDSRGTCGGSRARRSNTSDAAPSRLTSEGPSARDAATVGHIDLLVFVLRGGQMLQSATGRPRRHPRSAEGHP